MTEPSWRKPVGAIAILAWIATWTVVIASIGFPQGWPLQLLWFGVLGLVWIAPLKPALRWMETGRLR